MKTQTTPRFVASDVASKRTSVAAIRSRAALVAVASLALASAAPGLGATASATTTSHYSYAGYAYGTLASVGSVVKSGASAPVTLGCTTDSNLHKTNTSAGLSLAPLATSGTVSTTADTYASPVQSKTTAATATVNLLKGVVKATAIKAASSTTRTTTGNSLSSNGTTLSSLVVAGKSVAANSAPNTRINLSGYGYLIVNEQVRSASGLTVNGLHLFVTTTNSLGLPVGSTVTVSHAVSGLSGPVAGVLGGYAFGTKANAGTTAVSGPTFTVYLPCLGTGGTVRTNTGASATIGTVAKTGTIANTAKGTVTTTSATGETTSTVQTADILSGLVHATGIKADARGSSNGSTYSFSDTGSTFGSLTVKGHPEIGANVAANTTMTLPGVGTLYLHRVIRTTHNVRVTMIELVLTQSVNGLTAGTDIRIGEASTSVR